MSSSKPKWLEEDDEEKQSVKAAVKRAGAKAAFEATAAKSAASKNTLISSLVGSNKEKEVTPQDKDPITEYVPKADESSEATPSSFLPSWAVPKKSSSPEEAPMTGKNPSTSPRYDDCNEGEQKEPEPIVIEPDVLNRMIKWHWALRIVYILAVTFVAVASGLYLAAGTSDIGAIFFSIYVIFFCAVMFCFECALPVIQRLLAVHFGFLYTMIGRGFFLTFIGFMVATLSLVGIFAAASLFAAYLFHIFILCKFPRFQEYLRRKHYLATKTN